MARLKIKYRRETILDYQCRTCGHEYNPISYKDENGKEKSIGWNAERGDNAQDNCPKCNPEMDIVIERNINKGKERWFYKCAVCLQEYKGWIWPGDRMLIERDASYIIPPDHVTPCPHCEKEANPPQKVHMGLGKLTVGEKVVVPSERAHHAHVNAAHARRRKGYEFVFKHTMSGLEITRIK